MADKIIKTVSWHIPKKSLIKFEGDDDTTEIDSSVICDKFPKGAVVEYTLKDEKIISLSASGKTDAPKEEPKEEKKTEDKKEDKIEKLIVVITKVARSHEVVSWENSFKPWVPVAKELQVTGNTPEEAEQAWKKQGLVARNEVELTLTNDVITAVRLISTPKGLNGLSNTSDEDKKDTTSQKASYGRNDDATDKRTCIMCAKDVVVAMINNKKLENSQQKDAIKDLSNTFSEVLKNL
ncbi:MAG: hypothetical protein DRN27_06240 [Thermoplasmata archaeon]|nr:MAG: hypothetical protein DRN27_06240 [Thermoplasmata archaeon]